MGLEIVTVRCRTDNYAYLLRDTGSGQVGLVDAPEAAPIEAALAARDWGLDWIWITHHHGDHVEGVERLREAYGAQVAGHVKDLGRLPALDREVSVGERLSLGESVATVIDVSGHTIGHLAFVFDAEEAGAAFTGDSLMALGCGRVFEGTHQMMWESLTRFAGYPDAMEVYSGHNYGAANGRFARTIEPENAALAARIDRIAAADREGRPIMPATLGEERATNPFLRASEASVKAALGMPEADDAAVFAEIRRRKDAF